MLKKCCKITRISPPRYFPSNIRAFSDNTNNPDNPDKPANTRNEKKSKKDKLKKERNVLNEDFIFKKEINESIIRTSVKKVDNTSTIRTSIGEKDVGIQVKSLGIIGVPFGKGQGKIGTELAPKVLRKHNLVKILTDLTSGSVDIKDYGDISYFPDRDEYVKNFAHIKNFAEFMGCNKALIRKIPPILSENQQFLTLGGDHAIAFGSVAGHLMHSPNLSLVWVDAHSDINLHSTSTSGNIHGMPVSFLLEELRGFWQKARLDQIAPNCLATDQLVYIGLRDIDPYEAYIIKRLKLHAYGMDTIDKLGINKVMEMTLDHLKPKNKIHVSFDIDGLDMEHAPSTGTIVPGGLTLREGIIIAEALRETNRIQGIDLVEFNPQLGNDFHVKKTVQTCMTILKSLCGYRRRENIILKI